MCSVDRRRRKASASSTKSSTPLEDVDAQSNTCVDVTRRRQWTKKESGSKRGHRTIETGHGGTRAGVKRGTWFFK